LPQVNPGTIVLLILAAIGAAWAAGLFRPHYEDGRLTLRVLRAGRVLATFDFRNTGLLFVLALLMGWAVAAAVERSGSGWGVPGTEGRLVPAPRGAEERDRLRRKLVDSEAVRVLARKGQTLITENRLGLIQAAAGVDGSNVGRDELALLPVDPDASAAGLRAGLRERLGVDVAVVITDTMGRAWRNGQTDAAVGAAGLAVLHNYAGAFDRHGNELLVTEIAIADEIAAAADLVKGKLTAIPVAVVRGLAASDDGSTARRLVPNTRNPAWCSAFAEACPIPDETPVTIATLPSRCIKGSSMELIGGRSAPQR